VAARPLGRRNVRETHSRTRHSTVIDRQRASFEVAISELGPRYRPRRRCPMDLCDGGSEDGVRDLDEQWDEIRWLISAASARSLPESRVPNTVAATARHWPRRRASGLQRARIWAHAQHRGKSVRRRSTRPTERTCRFRFRREWWNRRERHLGYVGRVPLSGRAQDRLADTAQKRADELWSARQNPFGGRR